MSYCLRAHRHSNPKQEKQPKSGSSFFDNAGHSAIQKKQEANFFQTSLTVGQPGDQFEQEADAVANTVVNHSNSGAAPILQKKISSIQRMSVPMEKEKIGRNNEGRQQEEIQTKTDPLEEKEKMKGIQTKGDPRKEKEKMKGIQTKDDPRKEKEKMKGIQTKDDPRKEKEKMKGIQTKDDPRKEKEKMIGQRKVDSGGSATASSQVSSRIEQSAGKGSSMSRKTLSYMQSSFGLDFSHVNIHTDQESITMNRELGAQAFTHGSDIYFNSGKYNPDNAEGKRLLAHELTHVVQQTAVDDKSIQRMLPCPAHLSETEPAPSGWKQYYGNSSWFHCGFRGILEDRTPSTTDPQNECFYDHSGLLVDSSHPYSGCGGTPNSYDSESSTWDHIFKDPGGIWQAGWGAFWESDKYFSDERDKRMPDCFKECEEQPWYLRGFCQDGCTGYPPM